MAINFDELWEQFLYEFLKVDYSHVTGDFMQDFIWIVFMPSIVLLFYMDFVLARVSGDAKGGMKHLITIGIFVYILTQGLYGVFVGLTKPFFGLIVIIGVILMMVKHIPDILVRDRGNTRGGRSSGGGLLSSVAAGGAGGYALRSIGREKKRIDDQLKELENMVDESIRLHKRGEKDNEAKMNAISLDNTIEMRIANIENKIDFEGPLGKGVFGNHEKELERITRKWQKRMKV